MAKQVNKPKPPPRKPPEEPDTRTPGGKKLPYFREVSG